MSIANRFASSALAAGIVAGLATAALQEFTTTPLILEAERYEKSAHIQTHRAPEPLAAVYSQEPAEAQARARLYFADGGERHNDAESWAPADRVERAFFTTLSSVGLSFGFALVLLAAMVLAKSQISARNGLSWSAAAFAATGLAPAFGLGAELPGSAAAALEARQIWWIGTAVATSAGLYLMLRVSTTVALIGGLALLLAPHVIGAPHPSGFESAVPTELAGRFAAAALSIHAANWALVGTLAGYVWSIQDPRPNTAAA